jgi:hypothetical protein
MKFQNVAIVVGVLGITVLGFQNCSNVAFDAEETVSASSDPKAEEPTKVPPVCQEITAAAVKPLLMYSWDYKTDVEPNFKQVMSAPAVGDLNGDKVPEIVFASYADGDYTGKGVLRILNGATGMTEFSISDEDRRPFASTSPLLIDIDGDGKAEIVYIHYLGKKVIALNSDGSLRWTQDLDFSGTSLTALKSCLQSFSAADLDNDGKAEIIASSWIIAEDENKQPRIRARLADVNDLCFSFAANLEASATSEMRIIGYAGVMDKNGRFLWKYLRPGIPATANLLPEVDGSEVVVSGSGYLTIYNGLTGAVIADNKLNEHSDLICRVDAAGNGVVGGGQPTIGDFDGDATTLEIAVATGKSLTIFDRNGKKIAGSVTQDCSSLVTGITSFDFNGDGKPEIIYADEQYVRIFGMDGSNNLQVIWQEINPSGTLREYPVVADVNGDGYAELVVVANNMWVDSNNIYQTPEQKDLARPVTGLRVFGPTVPKSWMPTRAVWNQVAYMASNVTDDLKATASTLINGNFGSFFKRNTQKGLFENTCDKVEVPTKDL